MNTVLCDECFKKRGGGEEKTCTHGVPMFGREVKCVDCGKTSKTDNFHCIGSGPRP